MKRILLGLAGVLGGLIAVVLIRTLSLPSPEGAGQAPPALDIDMGPVTTRLAEAIRYPTISTEAGVVDDPQAFRDFVAWLARSYPLVHARTTRELINDHTVLLTWPGTRSDLAPILLTAHYDVVPVIPGSEGDWEHPPFEGVVADGFVWGRGAIDDKCGVVAILEAATRLMASGFEPARSVYFSFGHDEEVGGELGAGAVTALLRDRGVTLEWSLDEGSYVMEGAFPGVEVPMAIVNVAEKGYVTLELVARGAGGHSSMPPRETAVGRLAAALLALEAHPLPGGLEGNTAELMDAIAPHAPFAMRLALANQWLFGPAIEALLGNMATANAMMRTTTAPTMLSASVKENVLPIEAVAAVNFRVHPRDRVSDVVAHVERVLADHEDVSVRPRAPGSEASPVSSTSSEGWQHLAEAVRSVYGSAVIAPGLSVGGTDSAHYGQIAKDAYRFNPMRLHSRDLSGFHGTNERISIEGLQRGIAVYERLMRSAASGGPAAADGDARFPGR